MNLQMEALRMLNKSDHRDDPVVLNVQFDVKKLMCENASEMRRLRHVIENYKKNMQRYAEFGTIVIPNMRKYDQIVVEISDLLFDDMAYHTLRTKEHIEWKEYFHGLYELVVFPYQSDRTHYMQMINEIYKYYDVLKRPETCLEPCDPMYVHVKSCIDLFGRLKNEHKKCLIPGLCKRMRTNVNLQIAERVKVKQAEIELEKMGKLYKECAGLM